MATLDDLQGFSEEDLTKNVIIPLLREMGYNKIKYEHGIDEHGRDIVFCSETPFSIKKWKCTQVKVTRIHGNTREQGNVGEIDTQIKEALDNPYTDSVSGNDVSMSEIYIITSKTITSNAKESILEMVDNRYTPPVTHFLEGQDLFNLLEGYGIPITRRERLEQDLEEAYSEGEFNKFTFPWGEEVSLGPAEAEEV